MRFWGIIHLISFFQDRVEHWDSQIVHHHHTCCIRKFSQPAQNHIPPNQCFHRNKLRWVDNLAVFFEVHKHRLKHLVISFSHRDFVYQQQVFISQQGMFLWCYQQLLGDTFLSIFSPSLDKIALNASSWASGKTALNCFNSLKIGRNSFP